jgi:hypothetical protein
MDRRELVRRLVLSKISDDFENLDQVILPHVSREAARCGPAIERPEIVEALVGLVKDGLAKAYELTPFVRDPFSGELKGMPPLDVVKEDFATYFYVTKQGKDLVRTDGWWPLDDEGNLLPDWNLDGPQT